jgi:hypothetical protein
MPIFTALLATDADKASIRKQRPPALAQFAPKKGAGAARESIVVGLAAIRLIGHDLCTNPLGCVDF